MAKNYIGIEIDDGIVAMYQGGNRCKILVSRLPENLVNGSEIVSPELLSKFLKNMKKEGGFSGRDCALILPEFSTYFRSLEMPPISEKQLRLNLPYEFRDFVGNESVNYNFDYAVEGYVKDEYGEVTAVGLLAAAASKKTIKEYEDLLYRAGFRLKVALPREMALLNVIRAAVEREAYDNRTFVIIDVGFSNTRAYILQGEELRAAKTIEMGCKDVDRAIADHYHIDVYLAASYRETDHDGILESDVCRAVYNRISLEVMKTINFYKYENRQSEFEDCFICGVCSDTQALVDNMLTYVRLKKANPDLILPEECRGLSDAPRALMSIGVTL
ncbi:MAG: pilus assembly protein PilM [Ruminococcaceae bacterium]|nr:pilus assembly protein PilM [Oscillospiraceae bacterium]